MKHFPFFKKGSRSRLIGLSALTVCSFVVAAELATRFVMQRAVLQSLRLVRTTVSLVPERAASEQDWFNLFPVLPLDGQTALEQEAASLPVALPAGPDSRLPYSKKHQDRALPNPQSVEVSEEIVMGWVRARIIPRGRSVPAEGTVPAGIELSGVEGLGIGLLDGDRLISVSGVPVSERSRVVQAVLSARAQREPVIVASLVRSTPSGARRFSVAVTQPYPPVGEQEQAPQPPEPPEPKR